MILTRAKVINVEALQVKIQNYERDSGFKSKSQLGMHGGKVGITFRLWKYGQPGPAKVTLTQTIKPKLGPARGLDDQRPTCINLF